MEFGKLPSIDRVDFSLHSEPAGNAHLLSGLNGNGGEGHIYLGATGYNMKPWIGKWYPAGIRDRDMLLHYGRQFNTIEHNTTHYRVPDETMVQRWIDETPDDFRFCPKIPQRISHAHDLGLHSGLLEEFLMRMDQLQVRMGCCFIQLPPNFSASQVPALNRFFRKWPGHIPLAVEVRHSSFFQQTAAAEAYFDCLSEHKVCAVITDVAGRRDVCHMRLTAPRVMVRFVGNGLVPTDYSRINDWVDRLRHWHREGINEFYFFTHEPDNLLAPELAVYTGETINKKIPEISCRWPEALPEPPKQGTLF